MILWVWVGLALGGALAGLLGAFLGMSCWLAWVWPKEER